MQVRHVQVLPKALKGRREVSTPSSTPILQHPFTTPNLRTNKPSTHSVVKFNHHDISYHPLTRTTSHQPPSITHASQLSPSPPHPPCPSPSSHHHLPTNLHLSLQNHSQKPHSQRPTSMSALPQTPRRPPPLPPLAPADRVSPTATATANGKGGVRWRENKDRDFPSR